MKFAELPWLMVMARIQHYSEPDEQRVGAPEHDPEPRVTV